MAHVLEGRPIPTTSAEYQEAEYLRKKNDELQKEVKRLHKENVELKARLETQNLRPYGCTSMGCTETFENKREWTTHENSKHAWLEMWRCDVCSQVFYTQQSFQEHLKEHQLDEDAIVIKAEQCYIGRNNQKRFWCGFCPGLVDVKVAGLGAWKERFAHISDHIMRDGKVIQNWVPVGSAKPKGNSDEVVALGPLQVDKELGIDNHETSKRKRSTGIEEEKEEEEEEEEEEGKPQKTRRMEENNFSSS